jgi:autotransporter-associated beta strand protein
LFSGVYTTGNAAFAPVDFAVVNSSGTIKLVESQYAVNQGPKSYSFTDYLTAGQQVQFQAGGGQSLDYPTVRFATTLGLSVEVTALVGNYWAPGAGGGGSGTWSSANTNWASSPGVQGSVIQSPAGTLIFGNASGTVTVSNGVNAAAGMTFSTDGYSVTNSTITLTGANAASNTITAAASVGATISSVLAGSNGMSKAGTGTLTLAASNSHSGATAVTLGVLNLNSASGSALGSTSSVSVATNATLLVSQSNQVNDSAAVTLSGGTIKLAGAASETFGNLTVSSDSFLDFGNLTGVNMSFGTYTPTQKITINNFIGLSTLVFKSDMTSFINDTTKFSFANGFNSAVWDSGTSTFTITAIPEPSTLAVAAGLLALLLSPAGRRLLARPKTRSL